MSDHYAFLIAEIGGAMANDDCDVADQSERLANLYLSADETGRDLLDQAFTCLCGWRLATLLEQTGVNKPVSS